MNILKALSGIVLLAAFSFSELTAGNNPVVTVSEISTNARTKYDFQSNGSSHRIEQNLTTPNNIHVIFCVSTDGAPGWDDRNTRYFTTTNEGSSWEYVGKVTSNRSGFQSCIALTNDDRAVVSVFSNENGGLNRTMLYVDLAPGVGSWSILDPGGSYQPQSIVMDLTNNQVHFTASNYRNAATSLTSPGTFLGYNIINDSSTLQNAIGIGTGIKGVAFITLNSSVRLIESTNNGVTWGPPQVVWNWRPADSMGAFRGIDITYQGSSPKVVFEVCKNDPNGGTYSPKKESKIMFWSPQINNGNAVLIDSAGGLTGSNPVNDVFVSVCRPVIGRFGTTGLAIAYNKARNDTDSHGNNFFDIYFACSSNDGLLWGKNQLTNIPGQFNDLHDCRYPSISNYNSGNRANIVCQGDTIPGSNVNGASESWAKLLYLRIDSWSGLMCTPNAVVNNGNEIPSRYLLKQNYPNPFNPVTQIEFSIPERSHVKITIYNSLGETVSVLLDDEIATGNYKADWNASAYPSGVYFYELKTAVYSQTRKMVLLK